MLKFSKLYNVLNSDILNDIRLGNDSIISLQYYFLRYSNSYSSTTKNYNFNCKCNTITGLQGTNF